MKSLNTIGRSSYLVLISLLIVLAQGCALKGIELTQGGEAFEPHMTWAGDRFGIVYYHAPQKGAPLQIDAITVDDDGKVIKHVKGIDKQIGAPVITPYTMFRLSDLVWNDEADTEKGRFAFAYTFDNGKNKGHGIMLVILDANLSVVTNRPLFFPNGVGQWSELYSPTLVWNSRRREYAIGFTYRDYKNYKSVLGNSLRVKLFNEQGKDIYHSGVGHNLLKCPNHCDLVSLTTNGKTGAYAVSYYGMSLGSKIMFFDINAGVINKTGNHPLVGGTQTKNLRLDYNIHNDNYFYTDHLYGAHLGFSIVQKNGKSSKTYSKGSGYGIDFSVTPFGWAYNSHIICATEYADDKIHCWNVSVGNPQSTDGHQKDLGWTPKGAKHPSVATVNKILPYLTWVQNGSLRFAGFVDKKGLP